MNSLERYQQACRMKPLYEDGMSLRDIAKRFDTNDMAVRRRLIMLGVPLRGQGTRGPGRKGKDDD